MVIKEREEFETFENEREKFLNQVEKILYHGISIEPILYTNMNEKYC